MSQGSIYLVAPKGTLDFFGHASFQGLLDLDKNSDTRPEMG